MRIELGRSKGALIVLVIFFSALLTLVGRSPVLAQNQFGQNQFGQNQFGLSDFRINQLSSEVAALRLQVNQLQAQISSGDRPPANVPRITPAPPTPATPAQFDRLATLVIELREQVRGIDDRLKSIEARLPQR